VAVFRLVDVPVLKMPPWTLTALKRFFLKLFSFLLAVQLELATLMDEIARLFIPLKGRRTYVFSLPRT
jgi:hypothetical protein